ncbi:MAG: sulfatase-like hydrolase/transferase [Nitrososphaeria archaeon]
MEQKIKNVILAVCDSLRRDIALEVGLEKVAKGVCFECVAQANCTPAAVTSILTGLNPSTHLIHRFDQTFDPFIPTYFSIFQKKGYLFNYLSMGKDVPVTDCQDKPLLSYIGVPFDSSKKLEFYLKNEKNFALLLHFWDTHTPYLLENKTGAEVDKLFSEMITEGKISEVKKIYRDSVEYLKENKVKAIIELLEKYDKTEETLFVVVGDHGEMLGEKYDWANYTPALVPGSPVNHVGVLIPETVDVPLIFFNPNISQPKCEIIARQVDILPTILSLLNIPYSPMDFEGVNLFEFEGVLAAFSIGVHPSIPRYLTKKKEEWIAWIEEPLFKRVSVRVLNDFYVATENGEILADFKSRQIIYNELRMDVLRAYANRFKRGKFKGIVSTKSPIFSGKLIFDSRGAIVISEEEESGRKIKERLKQLGYL